MLNHTTLENYYLTSFSLIQHQKWSLTEIENMFPYELDIYVLLLMKWIEEENARLRQQKQ